MMIVRNKDCSQDDETRVHESGVYIGGKAYMRVRHKGIEWTVCKGMICALGGLCEDHKQNDSCAWSVHNNDVIYVCVVWSHTHDSRIDKGRHGRWWKEWKHHMKEGSVTLT